MVSMVVLSVHNSDPDRIHLSAIYCSSGAQAAKRAAEGFDMVSFQVVLHSQVSVDNFYSDQRYI